MDKVIKTFISTIKSVNEEKGTVEAVVSDETIDRYQEVILVDAWKKGLSSYKKHGVLLSSHNYSKLTNQIGIAESVKVIDKELIAKFRYFINSGNDEADWGFFLAKQGLAAYSVGFLPKPNGYENADWDDEDVKKGKKPCRIYTDVELLEISQVTVPANPSALQKSIEEDTEDDDFIKEYSQKVYEKVFKIVPDSITTTDTEEFVTLEIPEDVQLKEDIITKPETTDNYHHVPVPGEEGKHKDHKIRTITVSKKDGIKGKHCVDDKKIISYMFPTDNYSMDEAKEWVKEHSKAIEYFNDSDYLLINDDESLTLNIEFLFDEIKDVEINDIEFIEDEEETMVLEAIEKLKEDIFNKFEEINQKFIELSEKKEEAPVIIKIEEAEVPISEEDSNYITEIFNGNKEILGKYSVQS